MGNNSTKKLVSLKEEIKKNDISNNLNIPQETTKNTSNPNSLENALKEKEKEKNKEKDNVDIIERKNIKMKDEVSQFEPLSEKIKNKRKNNHNNKENNTKNNNQTNLKKNNLHNEYIIDVNKYQRKKMEKK